MKFSYLNVLCMLACVLCCQSAQAQRFVVGIEDIEYYPIYAYREKEYRGFSREIIDSFAQSKGYQVEYKPLPIKRLFKEFLDGKLDFKFPDSPYWKQDEKEGKNVIYSQAVLEYIDGVMVLKENAGLTKDKLKVLGTVRGFTAWDYLDDIKAGTVRANEAGDLDSLMNMLSKKRLDGVYFNIIVANYFLTNTKFEDDLAVFEPGLPHTKGNYYMSTLKHGAIIEELNQYMVDNAASIAEMKKKYNAVLE